MKWYIPFCLLLFASDCFACSEKPHEQYAHLDDRQILEAVDKVGAWLDQYFSG